MAITYSIKGGADAAKFNIDAASGALTFKAAPDFEKPGDANADNIYEVDVCATDAGGLYTVKPVKVTVTDVTEGSPPQITSAGAIAVKENQTAVMTVTATDPDDATQPPPSGGLPWTTPVPNITNFNGTDGARWTGVNGKEYANHNPNRAYSLTSPDGQTLRFEIRSGEGESSGNERSEIQGVWERPLTQDFRVQYEFMLETGPAVTSWFFVLGQVYSSLGGSPPMTIEVVDQKMCVRIGYPDPNGAHTVGGIKVDYKYLYKDTANITRNRYYVLDFALNFSTGKLKVSRDGVQIVDYSGALGFQSGTFHWDFGVYRSGPTTNDNQSARYRNMLITP